ncbi:MAG TPA: TlpA disulfide reductase family protein [Bacteroidia bacterium]|nr:TlpA disulfide reductase family protein [Bacteroidia bacterium]
MKYFLLFLFVFPAAVTGAQETEDSVIIWQKNHYQDTLAPYFSLVDVNGNVWNSDSLRGKTVVLNFWSIYCPACFTELPSINKVPAQFDADSVIFISVLFEKGPKVDSVIAKNHFSYHLCVDGRQIMGDFYNNCFPTHIIIDRNGMIRYNICGMIDEQVLEDALRKTTAVTK